MKLAFSTLGNPNWSFIRILEEAQKLGFAAIEIRGIEGRMLAGDIPQFFSENQKTTKIQLKKHHLHICGFGTSVSFHDLDKYDTMIEEGKTAIDICSQMEIPFIRVFGDRIDSENLRTQIINNVIKGIKALCTYAQGKNVKVLLEVHGNFNTIENIMPVLGALNNYQEFGILWDIAHSDKIYKEDYIKFYNVIKPFIYHIHIKDHFRDDSKFELCLIGEGDIPIKDIVTTLIADNYNGYMSLEWEKKWHPELPEAEVAYPAYVNFMNSICK